MPKLSLESFEPESIVNTITDSYKYSKDRFQDYYELCDALEDLYKVELPSRVREQLSEEHPGLVPIDIYAAVNHLVARLFDNLFSPSPFFNINTESRRTSEENIRYVTAYLDWASRKSELKMEFTKTLYSASKLATSVGCVELDQFQETKLDKRVPIKTQESETGRILTGTGFQAGRTIEYPTYKHLQLTSFFPDPSSPEPSWAIYKAQSTFVEVLRDMEQGKYDRVTVKDVEEIKGKLPAGDDKSDWQDYQSKIMKDNFAIELLHFRGWLPLVDQTTGDVTFADVIATVANRKLLLQLDLNEWHYPAVKSFILTHMLLTDRDDLYPVGKIEASKDTLLHQFYVRNQRLINLDQLLNPQFWTDSQELPDYLVAESGRVHKIGDAKHFEQIKMGDISRNAYVEVDIEKDEIRDVFGSSQISMGRDPRRPKETAYGISKMAEGTDVERKFEHRVIAHTGLIQILRRYLELGQEYHTSVEARAFDPQEIISVDRSHLFGEFAIGLDLNTPFAKPVQRQEILQSVKLYQGDPDIDQVELKRRHFRIMEFQEVEKLVPDPKEKLLPIEKENMIMVQTGYVVPVPEEDHLLHAKGHQPYIQYPNINKHLEMHIAMVQQKQQGGRPKGKIPIPEREEDLVRQISQRLEPKKI